MVAVSCSEEERKKMKAYRADKQLELKSGVPFNMNIHASLHSHGRSENTRAHTCTVKLRCSELDHQTRDYS